MSKDGTGRWMTVHTDRKIAVKQLHRMSIVPRPQSALTNARTSVESVKSRIWLVDIIVVVVGLCRYICPPGQIDALDSLVRRRMWQLEPKIFEDHAWNVDRERADAE
jgi:hypothetical protein